MKRIALLSLATMALVLAACSTAASPTPAPTPEPTAAPTQAATGDIVDVATAAGSFGTLLTAATEAGLVETLKGEGPFTVFAPTDAAFAALPAGTLDSLLADKEALKKVLLYHVVAGAVTADQVVGLTEATSVEGSPIKITVKEDGTVMLNDVATVVTTDIPASNGVIHVIDTVIQPPAE